MKIYLLAEAEFNNKFVTILKSVTFDPLGSTGKEENCLKGKRIECGPNGQMDCTVHCKDWTVCTEVRWISLDCEIKLWVGNLKLMVNFTLLY